jgi:hypothetical protein
LAPVAFGLLAGLFAACEPVDSIESADAGAVDAGPRPSLDAALPGDAAAAGADAGASKDGGPSITRDSGPAVEAGAGIDGAAGPSAEAGSAAGPDAATTSNMGSCFGRCGIVPAEAKGAGNCGCDTACITRGDCCEDKHTLCAVERTLGLCTLTGAAETPGLCGTDLGFSFLHDGKEEILFGDSYDSACTAKPLMINDDAQGTLPRERPAVLSAATGSAAADCKGILALDRNAGTGTSSQEFAGIRLIEGSSSLSMGYGETPLTAFSDGTRVYGIFRRGTSINDALYIAYRDPSAAGNGQSPRAAYRVAGTFNDPHFKNITATSVVRFSPTQSEDHDYKEGHGAVFIWGRPDFNGATAGVVYLMVQPLPLVNADGKLTFAPQYFAGLENGKPRFSSDAKDAAPVLDKDFTRVMQLEVAWVEPLQKWVMLYGGDVADFLDGDKADQPRRGAIHMRLSDAPWGPFSAPAPVIFREQLGPYLHCDAPPSAPGEQAGCDTDHLPNDAAHSYDPGPWASTVLHFPGCRTDKPVPVQPNLVPGGLPIPCTGPQRGNLYSPNIIGSWTEALPAKDGYAHGAKIYVNLSTWAPYQVILTELTIRLP